MTTKTWYYIPFTLKDTTFYFLETEQKYIKGNEKLYMIFMLLRFYGSYGSTGLTKTKGSSLKYLLEAL